MFYFADGQKRTRWSFFLSSCYLDTRYDHKNCNAYGRNFFVFWKASYHYISSNLEINELARPCLRNYWYNYRIGKYRVENLSVLSYPHFSTDCFTACIKFISGETANSMQPPETQCNSQESGKLCENETCSSCNSIREAHSQIVRGTILVRKSLETPKVVIHMNKRPKRYIRFA